MPRTHEDIEHHATVDHRLGGPPIAFAPGDWYAIEVAHVTDERIGAGISTYETLIEKRRAAATSPRAAAVLRSRNERRVIAVVGVDGHEGFRHLASAWDEHHLQAERHAVAESRSLALYERIAGIGDARIDPQTHDAYAFEEVALEPAKACEIVGPAAQAQGYRGVIVFGSDDAIRSAIIYRFTHSSEIRTFRASSAASKVLGPLGADGETLHIVHPVKTFE